MLKIDKMIERSDVSRVAFLAAFATVATRASFALALVSILREPPSINQMRSAARKHKRFDPGPGITNLNWQSHSTRRIHGITITSKLETLYLLTTAVSQTR